jgi:hypothetical protein
VRLVVIAAATGAAASAAASTAVTSSCKLVGGVVPSVSAVAAVRTALVVGVAGSESAAASASCLVGRDAAASLTGSGRSGGNRSRSHRPLVLAVSVGGWVEGFSSIFSISLTATLA